MYKRLTRWSKTGTLHVFSFSGDEVPTRELTPLDVDMVAGRLAELEDMIESACETLKNIEKK